METGWNILNGGRGQNGNCTNLAWDIWELGTSSRYDWNSTTTTANNNNHNLDNHNLLNQLTTTTGDSTTTHTVASGVHALMYPHQGHDTRQYQPDPHLMCLKLGKRHYFEDATSPSERHVAEGTKRGKQYYGGGASTSGVTVARCQVEGCHVALVNAKDYHRRHKVCEMHSKAPKVTVLGLEQRFCQQCSRFHVVSEFDDSKRSCRRRLAGHNERRRKSSHDFVTRNPSQETTLVAGRFPCISTTTGRALSLLSTKHQPWISPPDLSSRCSAALRELIAENRASILSRQFVVEDSSGGPQSEPNPLMHHHMLGGTHSWAGPHGWDEVGTNVTLDLMQAPSSAFGFLSMSGKSREEEECSELWSSLGETHVVRGF